MYSDKSEIVLGLFQQIEESILLLQQWNKDINEVDDYLLTPEEKPRGDIYKKQLPTPFTAPFSFHIPCKHLHLQFKNYTKPSR